MTLLSGNPDGFGFVIRLRCRTIESNRLRSVALLNTSCQTSQPESENNPMDILEGFNKMNFKSLFQVIREIFKVLAIIFREDENLQS
jgi:hypothetical protein